MPIAAPQAADLERRKKVKISLRRDLEITPQKYEGRTYYVVKDPVSMRYYRFKEQEHFLIGLMDGSYSLDDAQSRPQIGHGAKTEEFMVIGQLFPERFKVRRDEQDGRHHPGYAEGHEPGGEDPAQVRQHPVQEFFRIEDRNLDVQDVG